MFKLDEQHAMVAKMVGKWCESQLMPAIPELERGQRQPFDLMKQMATTFGLAGMARAAVEKRIAALRAGGEEVGQGGDLAAKDPMLAFVVVKEISRFSPGFAMSWGVSMGLAGGAIVAKGTPEQIERWGVPLVTVEKIGAWCLTEPGAGSDAFGSMKSVAVPDGDGYRLRGSKTFITNGPGADIFVVYCRLAADGVSTADAPIAAVIIERDAEGLTVGAPLKKMGMRDSPTCELSFDDIHIARDQILGGRGGGRSATKESLASERSAVPAIAWGIIEECYRRSLGYVRERVQFGRPIGEFQAVQLKIADIYLALTNVENIVYRTAWMQKNKVRDSVFINATKAYCSQAAVQAAMTAVQIHGGYGYMEEYHVEKLARDAKLLELGAGTTDINLLSAAREAIAKNS